ncbi:MAG: hypothetical protein RL514_1627 [Verrucomicrobiota bacterium]|jgi:FkbM family methyltransferase
MKIHIVCYEDVHGWILGKFALKLQEHLRPLGIAATISKQPDPQADINHHIIYYDYDGRKTTTETVMVTHIDTDWKRERLRQQLVNAAMGICCSAESVDALAAAGLPREKLCFVNPGHDGEMRARRTVIGITSKVQPSGCKREGILLDLAQRLSPDEFQFRIMGTGWDEHVKNLRLAGFTVDHWKAFDRPEYLKLMPSLDYYLYLGLDEGSMGYMDALAAGVQTIVTTQGFHLDAPGGITHGWSEPAELFRIFESIAREKRLRQQAVANWTWPEYAKRHLALWHYLLARQSGQLLSASLRAPLAKMAVLVDKGAFAEVKLTEESKPAKPSDDSPQRRELPPEVIRSLRAQHSHLMAANPAAAATFRKQFAKQPLDAVVADFDGDLKFRCSLHHHIGSQIFWHGGYSQAQLRLLSRLLTRPDMVYLDAGANVGEQTVFAAKRLPRGQVFAFEPTTEVFQVLSENVRANGFTHVRAEKLGLGEQSGELPIYSSHAEVASDGTVNEGVPTLFSSTDRGTVIERVRIVRLDDFLAPLNLPRLDVMKVDVEGAEMIVLKGAVETIKRHRPVFIVEVHEGTSQSAGHSVRELLQFIQRLGYRIEGLQPDGGTRPFTDNQLAEIRDVVCFPLPVAAAALETDQTPAIEAEITAALAVDPNDREALTALLSLRLDQSRWAEAAKAAFQLLQQTPNEAPILQALAHCLDQTGEHETAAAVRGRIGARTPTSAAPPSDESASHNPTRPASLPLPAGEGRGEGERVPSCTVAAPSTATTADVGVRAPRVLLLADVPNWIFHRHCQELTARLGDEFTFTTKFAGEPFNEADYDLIYPLEFNLVNPACITDPRKYLTGIRSHCTWQRLGFEQSIATLKTNFAHVHAVSTRLQRIFAPHVPSLTLLSHGVDTNFFTPRATATSPAGKLRLGWAGNRLSPNKGFAELIAPLGQLPGVELVFCGYADRNLNREQMREFYASVDAVVCASDFEGNNNSLLEAAAMARALVTTDTGTVPEYLTHGASALIVERTLPALTAAVLTLRDQPELRAKLGTAARASVVEKFSWAKLAEAHRAWFRTALASAAPGQPDYNEIEQLARQALVENPDGVEALSLLAQALLHHRNFNEAARVCLRLLELQPTHINALAMLAKCLFQANELAAARSTLEQILELEPNNAMARENLQALAQLQANGARTPTSAAPADTTKPAADVGARASLPPHLQPELDAVSAAYAAGDLPAAHAILHRAFKANPDCDALRELAAESTGLVRAACPVPDFGDAVKPARLNIALMTFNALAYTKLCLASLRQHSTEAYNVFIVDNGSTDGTREWLAEQTDENLFVEFSPANLGVPGGRNRLLQLIQPHLRTSDFVIFMDNDIEVMPGWVEHFSNFFVANPHVGIATAVGHYFNVRGDLRELGAVPVGAPTPVDVACGGFVCWVRAATAAAVGEYDEKLGLFWHEDDDYTVRALASGWEVFIVPGAPVLHHEHKSGEAKPGIKVGGSPANQRYLANKWRALGLLDANGKPKRPKSQVGQRVSPDLQTKVPPQAESGSQTDRQDALSYFKAKRPRVTLPIRWAAPFFNPTGYASEAINFVLPLSHQLNLGLFHDTNITSEQFTAELPAADRDRLLALRDKFFLMRGGVLVSHNPAFAFKRTPDALYHVGRSMYETDRIPADWVTCCNGMDEVWVPSQFNVETFANSGVLREKLVVIPGAVDENLFDPAKHTPLPLPNAAKFNFVSVFEWSGRKAWDVLLAAYLREFSAADDVCLHLRTYLFGHPDADPRDTLEPLIRDFAASLGLGNKALPRIQLLTEQIATADLPRLYLAADCIVVPSRGEGWGRPMHEAMAMGRPVIATGWSANTEFMNADNSYLLDYELVEVTGVEPYLKHYLGHRWAQPSEKHLRELMRRVKENPSEAAAKGAKARAHVTKHFSRAAVEEKVMQRLEAIERKFTKASCEPVSAKVRVLEHAAALPQPSASSIALAWSGSFLDFGSLSHVNRELTSALEKLPGVRLTRLGQSTLNAPNALAGLARTLKSTAPTGTQVTVRHAWPPDWQRPATGKLVVMQPWEFGALPLDWAKQAGSVDEFWAYSNYVRRLYLAAGVAPEKVKVIPLGIDPATFRPDAKPLPLATRKAFKFLFVGGTIYRKGPDVLLRAYLDTFTAADDVCLVIKDFGGNSVYQGQTLGTQIKAAQAQPNAPEILHLTDDLPPESLPSLYTACDCLVHPYRGEGFGLPVLEAMACALPVICTGGGSTDDFATDEFAYRLPAVRKPIGNRVGNIELVSGGWLFEPDASALAARLRHVLGNRDEARAKGRAASEFARTQFTWQRSAEAVAACLTVEAVPAAAVPAKPEPSHDRSALLVPLAPLGPSGDSASAMQKPKLNFKLPTVALLGDLCAARAALQRKQFVPAWSAVLDSLKARPFNPDAWLLLAEIAREAGDLPMATRCAERCRTLAPQWRSAKKFQKTLPTHGRDPKIAWPALPAASAAPRLSVFIIAKNEERFLGQCLASIKGLADQLVVLDTGSTDRTVAIAQEHGAEVHHAVWEDDFSAARNAALAHCTGDWVMFLDADEELPPAEHAKLRADLQAPGVLALRVRLQNAGLEDDGCCHVPRVWRNAPGLFFYGRVHEQVFPSVLVKCEAWHLETRLGTTTLRHHGYDPEVVKDRNKIARNLALLRRAVQELPGELNLTMNLGLELVRSGQLQEGLEHYRLAFSQLAELPKKDIVPELRESLLTQFVCHLHTAKQVAELLRVLESRTAREGGLTASMHFMAALACLELKRFTDGAEHACLCLAKRHQPVLSPINRDILKAGPHHVLALCQWGAQQHEEVEQAFLKALAEDAGARAARLDFARWLAERGRKVDALHLLHKLVPGSETEPRVWQLGAQIALSEPEFIEFAGDWTSEAVSHHPENTGLVSLRAEALLLAGDAEGAIAVMAPLQADSPTLHAARLLATLASDGGLPAGVARNEGAVSGEFLRWYRRLVEFRTNSLLLKVNARLAELDSLLPTAARILTAAVEEATAAETH